jgi:PAS domain S-box-containing protein
MIWNKYKKTSLYFRLLITISVLFIFAYFGSLFITNKIFQHFIDEQNDEHILSIARNMSTLLYNPLMKNNRPIIDQALRAFLKEGYLNYIILFNRRHEILFLQSDGEGKPRVSKTVVDSISNHIAKQPILLKDFKNNKIVISPIQGKQLNSPSGYIALSFDTQRINMLAKKVRYTILIISSLFLVVALLLIQRFSSRIVQPVKELIRGTDEVSSGNFNYQIELEDEGDLGQLARQFNQMTLKLNNFDKQKSLLNKKLQEYNESLEDKVRERTEELQKIQEEVVTIFHQIPVGVMVLNNKGNIIWYNTELLKIVEMPENEMVSGQEVFSIKKFNEIGLTDVISNLYQKRDKQILQHHLNFRKNGNSKLVEVVSQPLAQKDSKADGSIFIIKDVTREVILEKKMIQDQRLENIGKIAGGIAHDFNNILAIILPNAQLLKLQLADKPEWIKYLDTIEKASEQAATLTRKILSFSRGSSSEAHKIININDTVYEFIKMFRRVSDRKIEIVKKLASDLWNIKAEKGQIEQIMMNLSVNARDAMPAGGKLIFKTENVVIDTIDDSDINPKLGPGKYVLLEIADTGKGISNKLIDKIFDPFFSNKKDGQGTGLGLSVVYGILKAHRGVIDVQSREEQGTTFRLFFPMSEEEADKDYEVTENLVSGTGTLLVVDDEKMIQQTLKGMLESLNYKVLFADNGRKAIQAYKSKKREIDAILMDIQMPIMDGVEAAHKILEINPEARIIFTSGYAETKSFETLRKMGYQLFLKKPYKIGILADIIQRALSQEIVNN